MFVRAEVTEKGMARQARVGDGWLANPGFNTVATDTNLTLTVAQVLAGILQYTGFSAGRTLTTPTAADLIAAMPDMDIGDSYMLLVSITVAYAGTWAAGTGVTLAGRATTPASTATWIKITKTSSTTMTWTVI